MTIENFIEKSKKIHGNKYNYSKVKFNKLKDEICIICPEHGEFIQRAINHLKGYGCKACAYKTTSKKLALTKEIFIEKARQLYGDKYDFSKVEYVNNHTKICIICPEHGEFFTTPNTVLDNHLCPKCAKENMKEKMKNSKENFILKAREKHGWKYDYSKVDYINNETKICITCPEHGEFWQTPHSHLGGRGCPKCGSAKRNSKRKLTLENFIKRARIIHKDKYDYSKVRYNTVNDKALIICPVHGEFYQKVCDHLNGCGCGKCGNRIVLTTEEFIERSKEVHGNKYNYSKCDYINNIKKACIICPEHGEFWQQPSHHMNGHGCPKCYKSSLEDEIIKILEKEGISYEYNKRYSFLENLQLDFYLPEKKIAIECQGLQHFEPIYAWGGEEQFKKNTLNDSKKMALCKKNGIKLYYYSNLGIDYPYEVFEDKEKLIEIIQNE